MPTKRGDTASGAIDAQVADTGDSSGGGFATGGGRGGGGPRRRVFEPGEVVMRGEDGGDR